MAPAIFLNFLDGIDGYTNGMGQNTLRHTLFYGANDIIRAYSPGGRAHDIAGTQGEMIQLPDWRRSDHCGIPNDL